MNPRSLLLAAAMLTSTHAMAIELICSKPNIFIGSSDPSPDPVQSISVVHTNQYWRVIYRFANGNIVDRANQYHITDRSIAYPLWEGRLYKVPRLQMDGYIIKQDDPEYFTYQEILTDKSKPGGSQVILNMAATCQRINVEPPAVPPGVASPPASVTVPVPAPTSVGMNSIPIVLRGPSALVPMSVGTMPITALIDTGATGMTVSETVANWLLSNNQATNAPSGKAIFADGIARDAKYIDNTVTIAGHELHNIRAGIVPDNADMLLGFSVLNQVSSKFAIDTANSRLVFE
jgi:hypothetical protein